MKIVFMGTPAFAVPSLKMLVEEGYDVVAVITQPDRPQGRKKTLMPTPVKEAALSLGLPVLQPERLRRPEAVAELAAYAPDLIVTAAYGQILPKSVLDLPRNGCVNVHGSLLPKYRGGAPIQRCIINGETVTGVTLMYMAEGLDTGDMISRVEVPIGDEDTAGDLFEKLSLAGRDLLKTEMPKLAAGRVEAVQQDDNEATYAPNLSRDDERIDWNTGSRDIYNRIRGLVPFSGAFTLWNGETFKIWAAAKPADRQTAASKAPGTVLAVNERGVEVSTGDGSLLLTSVQPAGKKAMSAGDFSRGAAMSPGTVLG
ncbi:MULTISPECIES: methionyl-tRNA formyltransferase [unclassified Paenibacillus]|uniref:methionyl-tRNA formyltransferase n=1 Tax=unclassified Paenibacillus TaxID=185978 RepID=UPI002406C77C|nr:MULTISPECIES: methionyl-tRNA formyltransferase [unclassified Paenibacillus]MDF9842906.1 methionyl-tRNA formyltransferase [Paenibacillus sp. PastF-2]MDF9849494.1 methionyl-tRNA formyltransferase [Paenibacillus sp. PastM-2]MDF9856131.1 methionyl-tRNA formyltransferase [Paenibacillus sp. PastF-1]MDH6481337.1 methionyl-tRNA formyltransferase [Paenibacillus sp. PastH-2]MDH6508820.1 methionyl-tRNA formyltransferase [Paenibacillus sp. PastM-3]